MVTNWAVAIGALLMSVVIPYIVNLCASNDWSGEVKRWLAIAFSLAVGIIAGVAAGLPTPETLVSWALAIVGATQIAYGLFKNIGITDSWLEALLNIGNKVDGGQDS